MLGARGRPEENPVSTQPRFENYPPAEGRPQEDLPDDRAPAPAPVVRSSAPPPVAPRGGTSRRTLIGALVFVPIVGLVSLRSSQDPSDQADEDSGFPPYWEPTDESAPDDTTDTAGAQAEITVGGRYTTTVPDGWDYVTDGGGGVEFTNGANRLSASSIEVPPSTLASELAVLARSHHSGFSGKIGKPVDESAADVQRARMTGTGTFRGRPATLLAEIWIDASGSGLLATRILTVSPRSALGVEAQEMVDQLSASF